MTLPNFLIIGAQKSGTTSLYHYLKQHPQVYMSPVKEPKFLALEGEKPFSQREGPGGLANIKGIRDFEEYRALFEGVTDEVAIGEASPLYIYVPKAVERIEQYVPNAKIIAILRHPVDRAYSHFLHWVQRGIEPLDANFLEILRKEKDRLEQDWSPNYHYKQRGFYYVQLKRYFDRLSREQIRVYLYEEFRNNPIAIAQDIFQFLEIDDTFIPTSSESYNVSKVPSNKSIHKIVTQDNPIKSFLKPFLPKALRERLKQDVLKKNTTKPQLKPELRQQLIEEYRDDILKLQDLLQRDLSQWLPNRNPGD